MELLHTALRIRDILAPAFETDRTNDAFKYDKYHDPTSCEKNIVGTISLKSHLENLEGSLDVLST